MKYLLISVRVVIIKKKKVIKYWQIYEEKEPSYIIGGYIY